MNRNQYLSSLPLVETASLPEGRLFLASNQVIYRVIESSRKGYERARQWRKDNTTDVALSTSTRLPPTLPVVARGLLLPGLKSRDELMVQGRAMAFVFPSEQNALEAASIDIDLCGESSSLYTRRHARQPAFEVTNGITLFRRYYFMRTTHGRVTSLPDIKHTLGVPLIAHVEGSSYWRLLPAWDESPYDITRTATLSPVKVDTTEQMRILKDLPAPDSLEDTLPAVAIFSDGNIEDTLPSQPVEIEN